jgi:hypothetical protein
MAHERMTSRYAPRSSLYPLLSDWLPVVLWAWFIWHLSGIPHLRITDSWWDFPLRKLAHMGVFGVWARLLARALTRNTFWSWKKIFFCALGFTFLYACSDEFHQTFVAGRHGSPIDVAIDITGAWCALGLWP